MDGGAPGSKQLEEEKRGREAQKFSRGNRTVWMERKITALPHSKEKDERGSGKDGAFLLGPQCTVARTLQDWESSAGLGILWGRHGAQTEGRKVQKRTNAKSEFLAAPGDDDSFW